MLYNSSEPEDLLSDPSFLSWYYKTGEDDARIWESWIEGNSDRQLLVQKAIALLETIRLPEKEPSQQEILRAETALWEKISAENIPVTSITAIRSIGRNRWMIAASFLGVLAAGFLILRYAYHPRPEVRTPFGQISHQQLPDGTEVTINANSRISYFSGWEDGKDREVWVDGEAFFQVRKTPLKSHFIVHTAHFNILVTGTRFNVSNRHGKDNVLLEEGSITLSTREGKTLMMKPGDFVSFDSSMMEKKAGCTVMLLAWKDQKMILDHTSIKDLAAIITDLYGTQVRLEGDSTPYKTVTAMLPSNNLNILLKTLEATSEFNIDRDSLNNEITIRAQGPKH